MTAYPPENYFRPYVDFICVLYGVGYVWTSAQGRDGEKKMTDTTHLAALISRLSSEKAALGRATKQSEVDLRTVWVRQCQKEINGEEAFLGMSLTDFNEPEMSDDDLLAELTA